MSGLASLVNVLAATALGYAASALLWLQRISDGFNLRYSDTHSLMLVEADGYFHLFRSQELLAGKAHWLSEPALSALGAALQLVTRLPLEFVAFWLPVALATASGLWIWSWGRLLRLPLPYTAFAGFIVCLVPEFFLRASPGWYDTDPGIAFFWHGCLFATACLGLSPGRPRLKHVLLLTTCALLLGWWWKPGVIMLPLCLLLWGATFAFSEDRHWRHIRIATSVVLILCGGLFLLLPATVLPSWVMDYRNFLTTHAAMLFGTTSDAVFLSISELTPLSIGDILSGLGGNTVAGSLALGSTALLCWRFPRPCMFFLPSLACIGLSLLAERVLYFAALPVALGVGLLPELLPWLKTRLAFGSRLPSAKACTRLAWGISLGIVVSLGYEIHTVTLSIYFQEPQDRIALALKRIAPPDSRLWNWWDDGYFLAARGGHRPLFDGGSQAPRMSYIAAHPLVSDDPRFARRWIRFFALHGEEALAHLAKPWGDTAAVWRNLDTVFSAQDMKTALAALPPTELSADWFAPAGRVFLYLPQRFLLLSKWWIGLGGSPTPDATTFRPHIDAFKRTNFQYKPESAQVILPQEVINKGYKDFGGVFLTSRTPLTPPWGGGVPGPYLVTSELTPWLYIVDEPAIASVGFRLLAPGGEQLPGFAPVLVQYASAGLWEVLP